MRNATADYNIIFIVGDALRRENLGCYGYKKNVSPTIDQLAKKGVLFKNAFCCSNHTDSSITSMMTGRYPSVHGIHHHGRRVLDEEIRTFNQTGAIMLAEILKAHGFYTIALDWLGRWQKRGFDYYGEEGLYPTMEAEMEKKIDELAESEEMKKQLKILFHRIGFHLPGRSGVYYTNQATKFIEKNPNKNFFLFIHNWDTHTPFDILPDEYRSKYVDSKGKNKVTDMLKKIKDKKWREVVENYHLYKVEYLEQIPGLYDAGVNLFNDSLRALYDMLENKGLVEKTIFVITADHGDNPLVDGIFVGHFGLYDPVIHVPLIITGPGLPEGRQVKQYVQHIDLFPTLLELVGIDYLGYNPDGVSILDILNDNKKQIRDSTLTSDGAAMKRFAFRTKDYKYIYTVGPKELVIPFDTYGNRFKEELYNLKSDPSERNNLVKTEPLKAKELKKKLLTKLDELERKKQALIKSHESKETEKIKKVVDSLDIKLKI